MADTLTAWEVVSEHGETYVYFTASNGKKYQLAKVWAGEDFDSIGNARLIAAAPELLEALEIITARVQGIVPVTANMEESTIWQAIFQANAAIAKARGQS